MGFPGRIKFYFPKAPPLTREFPWCEFLWTRWRIPWSNQILFSKGPPPHGRISLVRISLVTTAYSLVESNFIFKGSPPSRENFLGENFFGHDGVFLGRFKF